MKLLITTFFTLLFVTQLQSQELLDTHQDVASLELEVAPVVSNSKIGNNGFKFETFTTGINSKYSDYGVGFFKDKFISFSARKIGALAKLDPNTKEPYTKLYCSDITYEWDLRRPLLFSHILNKGENLGTISFSKEGDRIYFSKSLEEDTQTFQLYTAMMNPNVEGEWVDIKALPFNDTSYSIENPHLSKDGKTLYFSSNMPEAIGGYDIFKVTVKNDKSYGPVERVEGSVNTVLDEKFPQTSLDGKYLYFSSNGHNSIGGFDIFRSRNTSISYVATRNLGNTINTSKDEIAYIPATKTIGYFTSDREGGKGSYDIYKIEEYIIDQSVTGIVRDTETQIPLAKATVVLLDADGEQVATASSNQNGEYSFPVDAFLDYTILAYKEGFDRNSISFDTNTNLVATFETNITLDAKPAEIVETKEKAFIKIENILFDFNSDKIKDVSTITLNTVIATLEQNPTIKIDIKAHTDIRGSDTYNLKLSKKRAASAMNYIISKGISKDRLTSEGYGESTPLIDCTTCSDDQHEKNRRVEFDIIKE
ncbi:OmpA family protein [uncultured Dokdonia sp.]|mgnify:CR=1 FL=1|uniref:OmpA family protein n=1 Tax=uncultured Dokdonia sp. TaxID=575653 RepID=UPI002604D54A|nr:OmpA family protein [uncultured Dokdonia sp.]